MTNRQKAIKVGSSVAAVLPKNLLKDAGIAAGTPIIVERGGGGFIVRPVSSGSKRARAHVADEQVAETALSLIKRYQGALKRLADA
jgi:antitoxin component of MazEF toxin-antitoxin module